VRAQCFFVERLDAQAEVIDVTPFAAGRPAALAAEFALQVDEVDHRRTGAQVYQAQRFVALDHFGTEHLAVEVDAARQVRDAQDDVIDMLDGKRMHRTHLNKR